MVWNPDEDLPDNALTAPERRTTRRVLRWFERRAVWRASLKVWGLWLVSLPTGMLALWGIIQLFHTAGPK